MKTGVMDSRLEFHELPFYEIEGLCNAIVKTAIEKSEKYKELYEEYEKKVTRFSPAFEFCIHELGWMLYDPFTLGNDEVLFSNGKRCYVASMNYITQPNFDRHNIDNPNVGYPVLYDETIGYDPNIAIESIKEGIVDEQGYVDSGFTESLETLAELEVMFKLMKDKEAYEEYLASRDMYATKLDYITSKENVISAKKLEDGSMTIGYASENNGKVADFINRLKAEDKLAEYIPLVANQDTALLKTA